MHKEEDMKKSEKGIITTKGLIYALLTWTAALAPSSFAETGFLIWGNGGDGSQNQALVASGMEKYCKLEVCTDAISLGGNILPRGVRKLNDPQFKKKFQIPYQAFKFPIKLLLGEIDYLGNPRAQVEYGKTNPRWQMPANQYSFEKDGSVFIAIDTHDVKLNPEQTLAFLRNQSSNQTGFKIVLGHDNLKNGINSQTEENQGLKALTSELLSQKVDFYFSAGSFHKELRKIGNLYQVVVGTGSKYTSSGFDHDTLFSSGSLGFVHLLNTSQSMRLRFMDETGKVQYEKIFSK